MSTVTTVSPQIGHVRLVYGAFIGSIVGFSRALTRWIGCLARSWRGRVLLCVGWMVLGTQFASAQPNDSCANAIDVGQGTLQFTILSTTVADGPQASCAAFGQRDMFFRIAPTAPASYRAFACSFNGNVVLTALTGCNGTELACNSLVCQAPFIGSSIFFNANPSQPVILRLAGGNTTSSLTGYLQITRSVIASDFCNAAVTVNEGQHPLSTFSRTVDGDTFAMCATPTSNMTPSAWLRYEPTGSGPVTIDTCGDSQTGNPVLALFSTCGSNIQSFACNDNSGTCPAFPTASGLTTFTTPGNPIWIRVSSGTIGAGFEGGVRILSADSPPQNDNCENATDIAEGTHFYSTNFASYQIAGGPCVPPGPTKDVFFRYTPSASGTARLQTCGAFGDTTLTVRDACLGNVLACNDDFCGTQSRVDVAVTQGVPVIVRVASATSGAQVVVSGNLHVTIACDSIDFNNDTSLFDPQDIEAFLSKYSEGPCIPSNATCNDIDFNNDTSLFDPCDISSFLAVYSEGPCTACGT